TFESTKIDGIEGEKLWCTDLAYSPAVDRLTGTYAFTIPMYTRDGEPDGFYNLSKYTGGAYFVGITYVLTGYSARYEQYYDVFFLIDQNGRLYEFDMYDDFTYGFRALVDTEISTEGKWYYDSLYYDNETGYIFYSMYDGGSESKLYAISMGKDAKTGATVFTTYKLGDFASKVWPVAGLYRWNNSAVYSDEGISSDKPYDVEKGAIERTPLKETFNAANSRVPSLAEKEANVETKVTEETEETEETEVIEAPVETPAEAPETSSEGEGEETVSGNE
ncbi:MAG: hypothetical protein IK068_05050, partial [Lachnospiraceae bacterium]|nr:hypothetical protein [Lachnospiraceae bacterium]